MDTVTQRDMELPGGTEDGCEITDHAPDQVEQPRQNEVALRSKEAVGKYLGDLREARDLATKPPTTAEAWDRLWKSPVVFADHWLLKLLVRIYAVPAIAVIAFCYYFAAGLSHPARGVLLAGLAAGFIWLVFIS